MLACWPFTSTDVYPTHCTFAVAAPHVDLARACVRADTSSSQSGPAIVSHGPAPRNQDWSRSTLLDTVSERPPRTPSQCHSAPNDAAAHVTRASVAHDAAAETAARVPAHAEHRHVASTAASAWGPGASADSGGAPHDVQRRRTGAEPDLSGDSALVCGVLSQGNAVSTAALGRAAAPSSSSDGGASMSGLVGAAEHVEPLVAPAAVGAHSESPESRDVAASAPGSADRDDEVASEACSCGDSSDGDVPAHLDPQCRPNFAHPAVHAASASAVGEGGRRSDEQQVVAGKPHRNLKGRFRPTKATRPPSAGAEGASNSKAEFGASTNERTDAHVDTETPHASAGTTCDAECAAGPQDSTASTAAVEAPQAPASGVDGPAAAPQLVREPPTPDCSEATAAATPDGAQAPAASPAPTPKRRVLFGDCHVRSYDPEDAPATLGERATTPLPPAASPASPRKPPLATAVDDDEEVTPVLFFDIAAAAGESLEGAPSALRVATAQELGLSDEALREMQARVGGEASGSDEEGDSLDVEVRVAASGVATVAPAQTVDTRASFGAGSHGVSCCSMFGGLLTRNRVREARAPAPQRVSQCVRRCLACSRVGITQVSTGCVGAGRRRRRGRRRRFLQRL